MIKINFKNGGGIDVTDEIVTKLREKYSPSENNRVFNEDIVVDFEGNELIG